MNFFFEPNIKSIDYLNPEESLHCSRVLRLRKGDTIFITDSKGGLFKCLLEKVNSQKCHFSILKKIQNTHHQKSFLHLAIAPPKNSKRMEWFVEKATEIGISKITPLICEHSERKTINTKRLKKVAIAAMKQSKQVFLPEISSPVSFSDFMACRQDSPCYIAWQRNGHKNLFSLVKKNQASTILIGPEGDFSQAEKEQAIASNYKPVSLGNNILRTETAGIVTCQIFQLANIQMETKK